MLHTIGLVSVGFIAGVLLTALAACYVIGVVHQTAVRALDDYGVGVLFRSIPARVHDDGDA